MKVVTRTPTEVYRLWVEALRSGRYAQRSGRLMSHRRYEGAQFCCLGVLCDLARKDGGPQWFDGGDGLNYFGGPDGEDCQPPLEMRRFLRLNTRMTDRLIKMNDTDEATFPEIADCVEAYARKRGLWE